jgi:uncharacterized protein (TIGR02117 family)
MLKENYLILIVFFFFIQCAAPVKNLYPPDSLRTDNKKIYIVKHTWHTGIIFSRSEANLYLTALAHEYLNTSYLEVGWGDLDFYTADRGNMFLALKAVLWPTKSALCVVGFNKHPYLVFGEDRVVQVIISDKGFINLIRHINGSFALGIDSLNIKLDTVAHGPSRFYLSREKYHGFKTCNVWTAKAVRKTGFPITPFYALRAKNVISQIRRYKRRP